MRPASKLSSMLLAIVAGAGAPGCQLPRPPLDSLPVAPADACGAAAHETPQGLDVAILIDASQSTSDPIGIDLNRNGRVGTLRDGIPTDLGDSLLSAQVAGVRSLVAALAPPDRDVRVMLVSFAGKDRFDDDIAPEPFPDAILRTPLTDDPAAVDVALEGVLQRGSRGTANFSAALKKTLRALEAESDAGRPRRVLFLADSPSTIRPGPSLYLYRVGGLEQRGPYVYTDPRVATEAKRAIRARIPIDTFGLGRAAEAPVPHMLSRIAGATGGRYRPVSDPERLHCALLASVAGR